ncbi:hypothetical protein EBR66_00575 [bacterium]|nr:hypothetical protein [bacterium]
MAEYSHAYGLAFDVEKDLGRRSGFKPALTDLGSRKYLFGELRLAGFASLLRLGYAEHLVLVGGNEGRYKSEEPVVNRAHAIKEMLVHDHEISPSKLSAVASNSNTGGNIAIIRDQQALEPRDAFVVTNHYHLPRAAMDISAAGLMLPLFSAESFLLLAEKWSKEQLIDAFGQGTLAERVAEEIQGIADKLRGTYKPRTDVVPS